MTIAPESPPRVSRRAETHFSARPLRLSEVEAVLELRADGEGGHAVVVVIPVGREAREGVPAEPDRGAEAVVEAEHDARLRTGLVSHPVGHLDATGRRMARDGVTGDRPAEERRDDLVGVDGVAEARAALEPGRRADVAGVGVPSLEPELDEPAPADVEAVEGDRDARHRGRDPEPLRRKRGEGERRAEEQTRANPDPPVEASDLPVPLLVGGAHPVAHDLRRLLPGEAQGLVVADHVPDLLPREAVVGRRRRRGGLRRDLLGDRVDVARDVPRAVAIRELHAPAAVVLPRHELERRAEVSPLDAAAGAGVVGVGLRPRLAHVVDGRPDVVTRRVTRTGGGPRAGAVRAGLVAPGRGGGAGHQEVPALRLGREAGGGARARDAGVGVEHRPAPGAGVPVGADLTHGDAVPGAERLTVGVVLREGLDGEARKRAEEGEHRGRVLLHRVLVWRVAGWPSVLAEN